jgi:hypothetical protein
MYCNNSGGACLFFDIDVKGGESVIISKMLQCYNWMFFKEFPSMPKGEIVGMFSDKGRVCMFVIDGKDHDQQHNDDRMARSEAKIHFGYQKLKHVFRQRQSMCVCHLWKRSRPKTQR